jgi:hypothetical protein
MDLESNVNILSLETILDQKDRTYKKVLTLDKIPSGALSKIVKTIRTPKLSEFKYDIIQSDKCKNILYNNNEYMTLRDIPYVYAFLKKNGYTIDTEYTKLMKQAVTDGDINDSINNSGKIICMFYE